MTLRNPVINIIHRYFFYFWFFATGCCAAPLVAGTTQIDFPIYPSIKANILFWEKIYSTYSRNTAIIHDQNNLSIVYTTVSLVDKNNPGAQKKNDQQLKRVKQHYADILLRLSKQTQPSSAEEKRIAALFGTKYSQKVFRQAAQNIRVQTGLKEQFSDGVFRSGAYMRQIKNIFRSHHLPEDLAYLPHVESSFNPNAFSKFGAAGMWQFTRSTGKEFLRIDYIIDERRDPLISAEAAAILLKKNFQVLGSWPLALTAYNYGTAGMKRAVEQEGSYEQIFKKYRKGHFKFASRNFYSEFLAAVAVAKRLEQSGTVTFAKPVATVSVKLPAYTDALKLCKHLGMSPETLKQHNPALRKPVLEGTKYIPQNYSLKLPSHYKNSKLLVGAPASIFSKEQKRSKFYQVRPGDTAGAVAQAHKISLASLISSNNLNKKALIHVGQNLRIPDIETQSIPKTASIKQQPGEIVLQDNKKISPAGLTLVFEEDSAVSGNLKVMNVTRKNNLLSGIVEVQPDESIGIFSDWLKLTPEALRLTNQIASSKDVYPGQRITIEFINVTPEDFEATRFDFHQETQEDFFNSFTIVGVTAYEVLKGDTVWDICHKKFDLPLWLLKKYNDELDFNRLDSSGILHIPIVKEI